MTRKEDVTQEIEANYRQVKQDIVQIIENEMERIKSDPDLQNKTFNDLDQISPFFTQTTQNLSADRIKSICSFNYISLQSFWPIYWPI